MNKNPFFPKFEDLPGDLPLFPLIGVLLLPGAQLPLNIFEPRYINMLEYALANQRLIGIAHGMIILIIGLEATQNLHCVLNRGLGDINLLKAPD